MALELRKKASYSYKEGLIIEDVNFFPKQNLFPIVFEEVFIKESKENLIYIPNKPRIYEFSKYFNK